MTKKKSSFEFAIVLIAGVLQKLQEYSDAEPEEPPEIITTEIDYIPPLAPPLPPVDRPHLFEVDIVFPDPEVETGLTEF